MEPYTEAARLPEGLERVDLTAEELESADAVILLTDHDAFDYDQIVQNAPTSSTPATDVAARTWSGCDTRGRCAPAGRPEIPDVSVLIPAYNAMPYLLRCLDSVATQTLGTDRMEVVVVDDGSTDGTGEEVDRWDAKYPGLFRVVHAEGSGGPAKPRNTALDIAQGRYVFFLDADDYLGVEALERLLFAADTYGSDVVLGRMKGDGGRGVPESMFKENLPDADLFESRVFWTLAPLKLFRRELIEAHGLRFPTHFPNCSDQPFTAMAYLRAKRISVLADYDYYYAVRRDDGQHVTSSGSVSNRLDVVEWMCEPAQPGGARSRKARAVAPSTVPD